MTAMMIEDGKRVAAGGAGLQWHLIPIADIDLIARNTGAKENAVASKHLRSNPGARARLLAGVDDVATGLFVALQL
jgi:hypothetical protein